MLLKKKIKEIKRRYKKITKYKFGYNNPGELKKKYKKIKIYFLVYSPENGYSIKTFSFYTKNSMTPRKWITWITEIGYKTYIEKILPASNVKWGSNWIYGDIIIWVSG